MRNDLVDTDATPLGAGDLYTASTLTRFKVSRLESQRWLIQDLKFLIFDDTDTQAHGCTSQNKDVVTDQSALIDSNVSKGKEVQGVGGEPRDTTEGFDYLDTIVSPNEKFTRGETNSGSRPCVTCSSCPEFPHSHKPRKFRLFRPWDMFSEIQEEAAPYDLRCHHYVAVSYCWPAPAKDGEAELPRTYQVRDLDGSIRANRAFDDVLDRAVDVATSLGLRMIWIDQECLPQPGENSSESERLEQELGIQAMDLVYNRAAVTAGLHDMTISSQAELDALKVFMSGPQDVMFPSNPMSMAFMSADILRFFRALIRDKWYTRAWVIQEAVSSGAGLLLVFRRAPGLQFESHFRMAGHRFPGHSLDQESRAAPSQVIIIRTSELRLVMKRTRAILGHFSPAVVGVDAPTARLMKRGWTEMQDILEAIEALYPGFDVPHHSSFYLGIFGGNSFGNLPKVDAIGALTLLKTRHCRYNADRIAIMANMCGYEYRLDTRAVASNCDSLRIALLALAIINGDLSLFVPDAYALGGGTGARGYQNRSAGLLYPFGHYAHMVDSVTIRGYNTPGAFRPGHFSPEGTTLAAYLWDVSDKIDFTPIKMQFEEEWASLTSLRCRILKRDEETTQEHHERKQSITAYVRQNAYRINLKLNAAGGYLRGDSDDSLIGDDVIDHAGVRLERLLDGSRFERSSHDQNRLGNMLFEILRFLMHRVAEDPRAEGVANSIWHSIRTDEVDGGKGESEAAPTPPLPDTVTEELFSHPTVMKTPYNTLKLDIDKYGFYRHFWLLERIMRHGALWVGRYVPPTPPQTRGESSEEDTIDNTLDGVIRSHFAAMNNANIIKKSSTAPSTEEHRTVDHIVRKPLLDRQLQFRISAATGSIETFNEFQQLKTREERAKFENDRTDKREGRMTAFTWILATMNTDRGGWSEAAENRRAEALVSVFDVDGPCTVAVPYVSDWEIIPHPVMRSMNVCWVVERDGWAVEGYGSGERYYVVEKVRGMWEVMDIAQGQYVFT